MLAVLSRGEFLCTPEQICSRDLLAAGASQLRNVADETAPPAAGTPADFLRSPERWGKPRAWINNSAAGAGKLAFGPTPISVSPAAQRDLPAEQRQGG